MRQQSLTDERLMKRSAEGDRISFDLLVRRYARPLMTLINRMTGKHHRSEDIFQEVIFSCWKHRGQYEFPRPFKPWLYRIATNQCRQVHRKRDIVTSNQEATVSEATNDSKPDDPVTRTESASLIKAAVERLPEHQRSVVVLRIWSGMSYREIAETLDRAEPTVRSYMHHALKTLREILGPQGL